jgi:hypothetical protein
MILKKFVDVPGYVLYVCMYLIVSTGITLSIIESQV